MDEAEWMQELQLQMKERTDPWVVLEGRHAVEGAMGGWWDIVGVLAGEHCEWEPPDWSGLVVIRRDRKTVEATAGYAFHRGVIGLARQPDEVADVHGLMSELDADATVVVCPRLSDPSNVGAIIRNAAALGAAAVILGSEGASPFERKAVRASSGALFRVPVRVADSGQVLRCLKAGGFRLIGTSGHKNATALTQLDGVEGRVALVIGSEAEGLGSFWEKACDCLTRIPMESGMDSMNAAAASAVCLWELQRLREAALDEE
ncbi:RNA methyltransferase [Haloferula rosea]|uniref:RNA methyltransferase n=2 Tax=Haloferula rosea TaxID=490093 RepID=A0A934RB86_9BACT|nr:RNA methyltransferase [Haloferula rosea]